MKPQWPWSLTPQIQSADFICWSRQLCQFWKICLKAFLRYQTEKDVMDVMSRWLWPLTSKSVRIAGQSANTELPPAASVEAWHHWSIDRGTGFRLNTLFNIRLFVSSRLSVPYRDMFTEYSQNCLLFYFNLYIIFFHPSFDLHLTWTIRNLMTPSTALKHYVKHSKLPLCRKFSK